MNKRIIYILVILFFLIFFTGCTNNNSNLVSIEKDDILVDKALSYFKYSINDKKELMEKLFDNNEGLIKEENLTNEEKMFLVLEEYDRLNDGCIYSQIGRLCSFKKSDIENLVFDKSNFINDYKKERKYYNVYGIDLMYNDNIFQAQGQISEDEDDRIVYFDVKDVKKSKNELVIEFVLSYLDFIYIPEEVDKEKVLYYKNINDKDYVLEVENKVSENNNFEILDETKFNKFRYTLKIDKDKVYFKSIEKI